MREERKKRKRRGFTLVEMLAVMLILAVLAGATWYLYTNYIQGARATKIMDEVKSLTSALNLFEQQTGYMPDAIQELWKNDDGSGNPIPGWSGPYIQPPAGDTTATSLKSGTGATITLSCDSTDGEQIVYTGVPKSVAKDYDSQVDDGNLSTGFVTYDESTNTLKITVRKSASCI